MGTAGLSTLDVYAATFGRGLSAHFVMYRVNENSNTSDGPPCGICEVSALTPAGHLRIDTTVLPDTPIEVLRDANALAANFAFSMWRTRKVYFHTVDQDAAALGFGDYPDLVRLEATLSDHRFVHGEIRDEHIFSVYRGVWDELGTDLIKQIV
ncbi:hypothetical protein ACFVWF_28790 [Rhodococcus qingshengii]|uniref:hypothetical protein n=1 Tax=Rhodococcus qingshengii TaxID=334542 RepID=UPI0036D99D57